MAVRDIETSPVVSSNLAEVGYDAASQTLRVSFQNGKVCDYTGVAPSVYAQLLQSESKGRFFAREIRSIYPFEYVEG